VEIFKTLRFTNSYGSEIPALLIVNVPKKLV